MQENLSSCQKNPVVILHRLVKNALGSKPLPEVLQRIYSYQSTRELTYPLLRRHLFEEGMIFPTSRLVGMINVSLPNRRYPPTSKKILYQRGMISTQSKTRKFDALMGESSLKEVLYLATPIPENPEVAPPPPRNEVILYGVEFQAKASLVEICTFFGGK